MKKINIKTMYERFIKPWQVLEKKSVLKSKWLEVYKEKVSLPNGNIIDDFYTISGNRLVCVVAVTLENNIILIEQYRHGVGKIIMDIPGGGVKEKEAVLDAAKRELVEETGYQAQKWFFLGGYYPDPARSSTLKSIFLALDAVQSTKPQNIDNILIKLATIKQVKKMVNNNQVKELGASLALTRAIDKLNKKPPVL